MGLCAHHTFMSPVVLSRAGVGVAWEATLISLVKLFSDRPLVKWAEPTPLTLVLALFRPTALNWTREFLLCPLAVAPPTLVVLVVRESCMTMRGRRVRGREREREREGERERERERESQFPLLKGNISLTYKINLQ